MLKQDDFFKNYFLGSKRFSKNLKKTKKAFHLLFSEIKKEQIPTILPFAQNSKLNFSNTLVKKFKKNQNIIIIGMGGSILGTKSIYSFLKHKVKKKVIFLDNLDLNLITEYKKIKNLKNSCFLVISKSGNTLETIANLGIVFSDKIIRKNLIIITEKKDSALMNIVNKYNAEFVEHKNFVVGRYSVLSETGMLPAELMGLDLKKFRNLHASLNNKNFVSSLIYNVAGIYTLNENKINNSIIMNYDSSLNDLSFWYQQLVGESLGKNAKGINPILSYGPKDNHSLLQLYLDGPRDKFFTFFSSKEKKNKIKINKKVAEGNMSFLKNKDLQFLVNAQCKATKNVFNKRKIPFREINFSLKNEKELLNIFTFFVLETVLLSKLMNVDPFNQPAVEEVKNYTRKILA
jgi:glucose-6-phosphate isomerase